MYSNAKATLRIDYRDGKDRQKSFEYDFDLGELPYYVDEITRAMAIQVLQRELMDHLIADHDREDETDDIQT